MKAIFNKRFSNYWTQTETYESLRVYIDLNFDGLKDMIVDLIGEKHCRIDTGSFQNDMTSLKNKDDVLTLLFFDNFKIIVAWKLLKNNNFLKKVSLT